MTFDQIYTLYLDKNKLVPRGQVRGTRKELAQMNLIPPVPDGEGSYVSRYRKMRAAEKAKEERKNKRARRKQRAAQLRDYKQQQQQAED